MTGWALDLRAAARGLVKARAFSLAVIATLALGTGAATAMLSVLRATLLRPAPFPDAGRIVMLTLAEQRNEGVRQGGLPNDLFEMIRRDATTLEQVAAYTNPNFNITGFDEAERVNGEVISPDYFSTLGVSPVMGRGFRQDEDSVPGAAPVAVLGHALWQRRFGADPAIVGTQVRLNRFPLQVIGVMPQGFRGLSGAADIWIPRAMAPVVAFPYRSFTVVGRVAPGRALEQVRSEFGVLAARYGASDTETEIGTRRVAAVTPLNDARVEPSTRGPVLILFGAVGLLLLIACANVANLLLVRSLARARETAVRLAVGASRWRLARLVLAEGGLLAIVGGVAGLAVGYGAIRAVGPLMPPRPAGTSFLSVGTFAEPELDPWVLAGAWAVVAGCGLLFSLGPALRAVRVQPVEALKGGSGRSRGDLYAALTISEIALAVVLLTGSGLLLRSLWRLESLPLGFDTTDVVAFQVQAPTQWASGADAAVLARRIVEAAAGVAGVTAASGTYYGPFSAGARHQVRFAGEPGESSGPNRWAGRHNVTPGYFEMLGIPLWKGRFLNDGDRRGRQLAVVVSEKAAARFFPGEDPIGKRFFLGMSSSAPSDSMVEVVGVVGDVQYRPSAFVAEPDVYTTYDQFVTNVWMLVLARSQVPANQLIPRLRAAVATVDPDLGISEAATLDERGGSQLAQRRLNALLLSVFGVLALTIATVGVYGLIAHRTAERTREFGIRVAVGADRRDVTRMVMKGALRLVATGLVLGVAAALALTRLLASQLYETPTTDPATFLVIGAVLAGTALLASYLPARRAGRVEPLVALRD